MTAFRAALGIAAAALCLTGAASCTSRSESSFTPGKPAFAFIPAQILELSISHDDPATGLRWSAGFRREGAGGEATNTPQWILTSGPEGLTLTDRLADSGFIRHLLDTLATLRVASRLEPSGGDLRSRLGLEPPSWWLRWSDGVTRHELRIGSRADPFRMHAESAGEFLLIEGAALQMLKHAGDFRRLRMHKLMHWPADDADRVEIRWTGPGSRKALLAERSSGEWAAKGGTRLRDSVQLQLERLSMLEIEEFEVPGGEASWGPPWVEVRWKTRHDQELTLEIDSALRARSSGRPGAIFRLNDAARETLAHRHFVP
jgi:hypothetical protein